MPTNPALSVSANVTPPLERDAFAPARTWLARQGYTPFAFQEEVWAAYARGESGLIHAPTGMGKTYAALLGPLLLGPRGEVDAPPLSLLWITPLRALAGDTTLAIARAAEALAPSWTVSMRTGDTPAALRARQDRHLPSALVTTPESVTLLLSREDWRERFAYLDAVVVDEWHELMSTKRGVQVELALARLRGRLQERHLKLMDPRNSLDPSGAKAVAWMAYGIHGDELSSTDAAASVLYWLAAGEDEAAKAVRRKTLVLIDPCENPDGRDRFLAMMRSFGHATPTADLEDLSHAGVWPCSQMQSRTVAGSSQRSASRLPATM